MSVENRLIGKLIIEECVRNGVTFFGVAPGSRSTPLALAAAEHPDVHSVVHYDERALAFLALGHAKATGRPAAVITTSGTAVANLLPAAVEAFLSEVPLIFLTADRPVRMQDCGANQTIRQMGIFGDYVRWEFDIPAPSPSFPSQSLLSTLNYAVFRTQYPIKGPVHLNIQFDESLVADPLAAFSFAEAAPALSEWISSRQPFARFEPPSEILSPLSQESLNPFLTASKGLLLIGALSDPAQTEAALAITRRLGWPCVADLTSGLGCYGGFPFVPHYEWLLQQPDFAAALAPDTVIYLGGSFTSKGVDQLLAALPPATQLLRISGSYERKNPFHRACLTITCSPVLFLNFLQATLPNTPSQSRWEALHAFQMAIAAHLDTARSEAPDSLAFSYLLSAFSDTPFFLGNSLPIRLAASFRPVCNRSIRVLANRGASGIDGLVATAAGMSLGLQSPVTAILGDLSTFYDLNALAILASLHIPLRLFVINNAGGGIFQGLPVAALGPIFESHFKANHPFSFESFAHGFGIAYERPASLSDLERCCHRLQSISAPALVEIQADSEETQRVLSGYR